MSVFDKIFKRNQINVMPPIGTSGLSRWWGFTSRKYSDAYAWMVIGRILAGLKNVNFYYDDSRVIGSEGSRKELDKIVAFINTNADQLVWLYWSYGYIVVTRDASGTLCIPDYSTLRRDGNGSIMGYDVVIYSPAYKFNKKSDFEILRQNINNLDDLKNSENYLTTSLGALAVMSGKAMPINPNEKREFLNDIKKNYGTTSDKYQILLTSNEVSLQQLNLPIKDLELGEKIKNEIKLLAGYFNVPYDLIPFSGQSTYANQEQAVVSFYRNCIAPLSETLLEVARYLVKKEVNTLTLVPSEVVTFRVDNVPELADDRTADIEYKTKVAQMLKAVHDAGIEVDEAPYIDMINTIER